jgi:hypothetical protein
LIQIERRLPAGRESQRGTFGSFSFRNFAFNDAKKTALTLPDMPAVKAGWSTPAPMSADQLVEKLRNRRASRHTAPDFCVYLFLRRCFDKLQFGEHLQLSLLQVDVLLRNRDVRMSGALRQREHIASRRLSKPGARRKLGLRRLLKLLKRMRSFDGRDASLTGWISLAG